MSGVALSSTGPCWFWWGRSVAPAGGGGRVAQASHAFPPWLDAVDSLAPRRVPPQWNCVLASEWRQVAAILGLGLGTIWEAGEGGPCPHVLLPPLGSDE